LKACSSEGFSGNPGESACYTVAAMGSFKAGTSLGSVVLQLPDLTEGEHMPRRSDKLDQIRRIAGERVELAASLAATICSIPAPTGDERVRADFVAKLLSERGYTPDIDDIFNVYARRGNRGGPALVLLAHTDTVFPTGTDLRVTRDGDRLSGAGIGDNSLGVAAMVTVLDVLDELELETAADIIAVANVGEEGLGNLRGAREAMDRYGSVAGAVIAIEGHNLGRVTNVAVGSKRWRITVDGPGGHSWGAFGAPSAIHGLAKIIADISRLSVPESPRTTFNVGLVHGGTSINTIAPSASALVDMRSVDPAALDTLSEQVARIARSSAGDDLRVTIEVLGERPAGARELTDPLVQCASNILSWLGIKTVYDASSTDANIAISRDIPALCIGITRGGRVHTTEEYIEVSPIELGLAQLARLCVDATTLISTQSSESS
jgi:tripeptide aminopeptidase